MKQIFNNIIPFPGFVAINLFGTLFIRKKYQSRTNLPYWKYTLNHESIHTELMRDFCKILILGGLVFYICYFFEWLFRVLFTKDKFSHQAYRNISFEQEAYNNEKDLTYLDSRKHFALWR